MLDPSGPPQKSRRLGGAGTGADVGKLEEIWEGPAFGVGHGRVQGGLGWVGGSRGF